MRIAPRMSKLKPVRTIRVIGTAPEPYTMAFCGVDTGSMNPKEAAKVAARAGTKGSTPMATHNGMTIGTTTAAEAVLLVVRISGSPGAPRRR